MLDDRYPHRVASYKVTNENSSRDGILLSHPARTQGLHVNTAGAMILALCDGQRTVGEIARILGEAYPESAQGIEQNILDTLLALTDYGAIEWT